MPDLEYVARMDGPAGPRGTVITAEAWSDLDEHARDDFAAREVAAAEPAEKE